jgi:FkbM family methyltransferase
MSWLSSLLSVLPFTVNVSGRKHNAIMKIGHLFKLNQIPTVNYKGTSIIVKGHAPAQIINFAAHNFFQDFERSALAHFMHTHLQKGALFIDVGANLGGYSFLAKQQELVVYNAEPVPGLSAFLQENEVAFGHHVGKAFSNENGSAEFYISDDNIGGSSLIASNKGWEASGYTHKVQVPVVTFDSVFCNIIANHTAQVMVKIDVEGNEEKVVQGMLNTLATGKINYIWCEVRGPQSDRNANSYLPVVAMLEASGFDAFSYATGSGLKVFDKELDVKQFFDLVFIKRTEEK